MKINILTIFPEMFAPLRESMLARAEGNGIIEFNIVDIRSFSSDKHRKVDDYPFGGGCGMVFTPQPAFDALKSIGAENGRNIYMSPRGKVLDMNLAFELSDYLQHSGESLTVLCGHYEGIDQRIIDEFNMEEVSIGDYILTGGELAAMVLVDAVSRLIPGVLAEEESATDESIYSGLLEYPQYTQPRSYNGLDVPEILLSGNHKEIDIWRFRESVRLTKERRPDILKSFLKNHPELSKDEIGVLMDELGKTQLDMLLKSFSESEKKNYKKLVEKREKLAKNMKKLL